MPHVLQVKRLPSFVCSGSYLCNLSPEFRQPVNASTLYGALMRCSRRNAVMIVGNEQRHMKRAIAGLRRYAELVRRKWCRTPHHNMVPPPRKVTINSTPWSSSAKLYRIKLG